VGVQSDLIYDIGAAYGDDSAYYLHKGYRVVAVEANPLAISQLKQRFDSETRQGRFTLVPLAIAADEREALFWVCDDDPNISSFDRSRAGHNGARHHSILVQTCRFRALVNKYGTPLFCKIDIEGSDTYCLRDLTLDTRPPFISAELCPGDHHIERLRDLGYTRFKILSQRTFLPPKRAIAALKARMPRRLSCRITNIEERFTRYHSDGAWRFLPYSSGPFGRGTCGR
jgi:FkbM family methyltransferase